MATLTKGVTFGATETVTNTKLHNLVDNATVSGIVNADIDSGANISDSKLGPITTSGKVGGTAFTGLASVPSSAGRLPLANMNLGLGPSLASIPNTALLPLTLVSHVDGISLRNLASLPTELFNYNNIVSSLASGAMIKYDGVNNFVGREDLNVIAPYTDDATVYDEATAATERSTTSASFTKLKELSPLVRGGQITVAHDMKETSTAGGGQAESRLYINGVAVGTTHIDTTGSYATYTDSDVAVNAGDVIQIYGRHSAGTNGVTVRNLTIRCDNPITAQEVSGL